jgi:hypothetical protein
VTTNISGEIGGGGEFEVAVLLVMVGMCFVGIGCDSVGGYDRSSVLDGTHCFSLVLVVDRNVRAVVALRPGIGRDHGRYAGVDDKRTSSTTRSVPRSNSMGLDPTRMLRSMSSHHTTKQTDQHAAKTLLCLSPK